MNRPIDWKKLSELKRQATPPEVPLGDMLSELLEGDAMSPAWDAMATAPELGQPDLAAPPLEVPLTPAPCHEDPTPVYSVTPNLEIHSKVEMALSELSASAVRYSECETAAKVVVAEAATIENSAMGQWEAPTRAEASTLEATMEAAKPQLVPVAGRQPAVPPLLVLPKPAPVRTPAARKSEPPPAAPNLEVDDLLAMLLGSESATSMPPLVESSHPMELGAMSAAEPSAGAESEQAPPAAFTPKVVVCKENSTNPDLDEPVSAMEREVERSPFGERTGVSIQSTYEPRIGRESCLVFSLGGAKFGIPIHQVVELDKLPRVTAVPNVPYWVLGVTNLRGEILSVLDLRQLLGMESRGHFERGRILVVRLGEEITAALVVDEVSGISNYDQTRLTPPDAAAGERVFPLLDGVYTGEDLILRILNMEKLMATSELRRLEAA